jgi:hypothetical protein
MSDSDSEEVIDIAPKVAKPTKVKMPRSAAQIAATQKGLEALARRRAENAIAKERAAEKPAAKPAEKPKRVDPKPDPTYFTPEMLQVVKDSVRHEIERAKMKPKKRVVVVSDSSSEEEVVVKRKRKIPDPPPAPRPSSFAEPAPRPSTALSGSDLLDRIFFR